MKSLSFAAALSCLIVLATSFALQAQKKPVEAHARKNASIKDPTKAFATPCADHVALETRVGKWTTLLRMWNDPATQPSFDTGTAEIRWILGGRYLESTYEGTFLGGRFSGLGLTGFDNIKEKYVTTWIDDAGTGILHSEGTFDAATQTITYTGECPDANDWTYVKSRTVEKTIDADHWTQQIYTPGPDGADFLCMDIAYTRVR